MLETFRNSMGTLFWKYSQELLKWRGRLPKFELDFYSVCIYKITCKWGIMVGIEPIPTGTSLVIIGKDPLEPLNVRLFDLFYKFRNIIWLYF